MTVFSPNDRLKSWLSFYFVPQIGVKRLQALLQHGAPETLIQYTDEQLFELKLNKTQIKYLRNQADRQAEQSLNWLSVANNRHIITLDSPEYPPLLKHIDSPPAILYVEGDVQLLSAVQIAIVGSRDASVDGMQIAELFSYELAKAGVVVTSGLALGIDGYAHKGALGADIASQRTNFQRMDLQRTDPMKKLFGKTLAVLGSGLERIYPAQHYQLSRQIVDQGGALVSEFAPNEAAKSAYFPRRNRIISGLCSGILVVEAAKQSGSLITARYALSQGRDVFAVPGSIFSPLNYGSNELIKNGAYLVQSAEEILEHIDFWPSLQSMVDVNIENHEILNHSQSNELPFAELLANVGSKATPIDILASRTNIPIHEVMTHMLELELLGHVIAVDGGYVRKGRGNL